MIDECIDSLIGNTWFSKLDANSAYFQIKVNENDKRKTAFITKYGTFQFIKMPFGLCNAPSTFSTVMNLVLRGLNWKTVLAFLDDILVLGNTFRSHIENLRQVWERFRSYGLKLKPKKCELFQIEVEFLGRKVSKKGIEVGPGYVETIIDWPIPKCTKDVEKFCGFANYHRNFIQDFAELAIPSIQSLVKISSTGTKSNNKLLITSRVLWLVHPYLPCPPKMINLCLILMHRIKR